MDAKATVLIGELSRGGYTRVTVKALDHDYRPDAKVTPFGIFLPEHGSLFLYFTTSRVTSDFMVDCLSDCWKQLQAQFPKVRTLLIHQDNGPECHSRRTQLMKRMVQLADDTKRTIHLAYYPPYHSKYNPIERIWGGLEQHWNGSLLDSVDTVVNFATTFSWRQLKPMVTLVEKHYDKGIKLNAKAMALLENRLERLKGLEKWFVKIAPLDSDRMII
jgi:hypothetical protein